MAEASKAAAKKPFKGGSKGGTRFPRLGLADALTYSKKLVSKTFNGSQPAQTILVGVFNNKGPEGEVRASALKQYGLMQGEASGYEASSLARQIEAAVPEEKTALIQQAFLIPKIFKQIYETLQSETATRARVRQVVVTGEVHPDSADKCVQIFIDGAVHAGLGSMDGESIVLGSLAPTTSVPSAEVEGSETGDQQADETLDASTEAQETQTETESSTDAGIDDTDHPSRPTKPGVNLNLNVDSSSDPEKLEKQLKLLKRFGLL